MVAFREPITESAPHIYLSALPFTPLGSLMTQIFRPFFSNMIDVGGIARGHSQYPILFIDKHKSSVNFVAFSPDGKRIVSGSHDKTIRVWDIETGEAVSPPFEGRTDTVTSVTFSPDGKRIVSSSHDATILLWDTDTGEAVSPPFKGHTDGVTSVAFSPDGKRIVSGPQDATIQVWNVRVDERAYKAKSMGST
ncbi:hypothetical protein HETIRDRAFT_172842 [Heterobasidion irregulare TC 32-1]|uniref:Uncharacterized protein n=1 Tax=Heterobasidion irregulare (strain TC 32-1) TaxID=747525 RepID=W4K2F3_HETIT|nr:uncharacterized protein HETIRDRAFT_172842 [Heterobasidion irregulare TC 32-1]ETW79266.1 hypothetical protein HETIRDRAFT_172842 [Heterobasidion irregulare TC 32-1]